MSNDELSTSVATNAATQIASLLLRFSQLQVRNKELEKRVSSQAETINKLERENKKYECRTNHIADQQKPSSSDKRSSKDKAR